MLVIGLTGGIASGKSTVAGFLKEWGARVIDTDQIAREVVLPSQPAYHDIVCAFGKGILAPDGHIDRRALGRIVFKDPSARKLLNAITHPRIKERVIQELERLKREDPQCIVVIEAPLLIEAGFQDLVDLIWVVTAPPETRLKRLLARNNLTQEEAQNRMGAQMEDGERLPYAHRVIFTGTSLEATRAAVWEAWQSLKRFRG